MNIHGTAKGGAVGKKDFGVAFSSGGGGITEYETTTYTNNDANDDGSNHKIYTLSNGTVARLVNASQIISGGALDGFKMKQMKVLCQKLGSPSNGNLVYGRIWDTDSLSMDVLETSSDTFNVDAISTSAPYTELTFNFTGDITLNADYKIGIYWAGGGGTGNGTSIVLRAYYSRDTDNDDVIFNEFNPGEKCVQATTTNLWQWVSV